MAETDALRKVATALWSEVDDEDISGTFEVSLVERAMRLAINETTRYWGFIPEEPRDFDEICELIELAIKKESAQK
jgi:hypothetical protein